MVRFCVLKLAPTADARIARGNLHRERGDAAAALADYDAALKIAPKSPFARNNRGELLADQSNWAGAIAEYDAALKEFPGFGLALVNRGMAKAKRLDYAGAVADYNVALKQNPLDAAAANGGAWLLATCADGRFRDGKRAVDIAKRACQLSSDKDWNALDTLAAAYAEAGDFPAALVALAKARALVPDDMKPALEAHAAKFRAKQPIRE